MSSNPCDDSDGLKTAPDGPFFPRLIKIWLYCQGGDIYIGEFYIHSFSRGKGKTDRELYSRFSG